MSLGNLFSRTIASTVKAVDTVNTVVTATNNYMSTLEAHSECFKEETIDSLKRDSKTRQAEAKAASFERGLKAAKNLNSLMTEMSAQEIDMMKQLGLLD